MEPNKLGDWGSWDGDIQKRVIQPGVWDGNAVQESSVVTLCVFDIVNRDPTIISDLINFGTQEEAQTVGFVAGETDSHLDRLLDRLSRKMFVNETCYASFLKGKVEMCVRLEEYTLPKKPVYDWSHSEKLQIANKHKIRGDELFKMKRIEDAIARYRSAIRLAVFSCPSPKEGVAVESKGDSFFVVLCSNLAQFRLVNDQPELALQLCDKVLARDGENVKCLLRRGRALFMLGEGERSREDLVKALRLEPNNQGARALLRATEQLISAQKETDARLAKRMLALDV